MLLFEFTADILIWIINSKNFLQSKIYYHL